MAGTKKLTEAQRAYLKEHDDVVHPWIQRDFDAPKAKKGQRNPELDWFFTDGRPGDKKKPAAKKPKSK